MNMFWRELKAGRKGLIIWSIGMFLLIVSGMGKYTAYSSGGASSEVFNQMPAAMKALMGIGTLDVTVMSGYFALLFLYMELTAAIHAVLLGSSIIAKEEREKTAEFLLAKPVSRSSIVTSKLLAALVQIIVLNLVTLVSSILMVSAYNKGKDISAEISLFLLSMLIVQLIFLALGALLAAILKNPKRSGAAAAGILVSSFIVAKITELSDQLVMLNILSPFKYFSYNRIVEGNGLNAGSLVLGTLLAGAFAALTYFMYGKRELEI
ncbi:ABC transporter [Paenibacillus sp. FSL R7-0273]|uniref:ABC transporter permease subunit n=1 Tax=Paenibacillus sp. FSL R7-0273 TaxID=1536772 RepID=UPI0004F5B3EA|nr:ABC transporter permease subunit [Paenibacillus sp. FSL R7-0273]AIQ47329.1 ABC transporter [Paenibacillus sp. FSL R7-0273]OMF96118.1 ABC transporter [Paenibacillus sp. FSL R7-0273]